jgi:hypothetical protein
VVRVDELLLFGRGRDKTEELPFPPVLFIDFLSLYSFWIARASAEKLRRALARKTDEALGLASAEARAPSAGSRARARGEASADDDEQLDRGETVVAFFANAAVAGATTVELLVVVDGAVAASAAAASLTSGERSRRESAAAARAARGRHAADAHRMRRRAMVEFGTWREVAD